MDENQIAERQFTFIEKLSLISIWRFIVYAMMISNNISSCVFYYDDVVDFGSQYIAQKVLFEQETTN